MPDELARALERRSVRAKRAVEERIARAVLRRVAAVSAVTPSIAEEAGALAPPPASPTPTLSTSTISAIVC